MTEIPSALQPAEVSAAALFSRALHHCARRAGMSRQSALDRLRAGDLEMHGTFRYALAKGLGEYLGSLGVPFRAVYVYGSAMAEASSPCSDIDIVLDLEHDADQVDRLMRGLDIALVTQFRALFPWARGLISLLDVRTIVGESDNDRNRYSGGVCGLGTFPICLWRPTPEAAGDLREEVPRRSNVASAH